MPTQSRPNRNDEVQAGHEYSSEPRALSQLDGELSDDDLEQVLGGLERIHFPEPPELPLPLT